jgi:hypothetical protein
MAMTVDYSRAWLKVVQLRTSTQAFCQAYANAVDFRYFMDTNNLTFDRAELQKAYNNLARSSPAGAQVSAYPMVYVDAGYQVLVVNCTGTAYMDRMIGIGTGPLTIQQEASAKTKMGTTSNWK